MLIPSRSSLPAFLSRFVPIAAVLSLFASGCGSGGGDAAAALRAAYLFNNSLAGTGPALEAVNPTGRNSFQDASVFGSVRMVYSMDGDLFPVSQQAGLRLNTAGLIPPADYSLELVISQSDKNNAWRKIIDTDLQASDDGVYVSPENRLAVFDEFLGEVGVGTVGVFTLGAFHHVVITVAPSGQVRGYLDGVLEFTINTSILNIDNAQSLLGFFLDDGSEYSDTRIALLRVYSGVLTPTEVTARFNDPF